MNSFKLKFALQFIIDVLVVGIICGILARLSVVVLANIFDADGANVSYSLVIPSYVFGAIAVVIAVFITQNALKKKDLDNYPLSSVKFYIVFAAIVTIINIAWGFLSFGSTYNMCLDNAVDPVDVLFKVDYNKAEFEKLVKVATRNAIIIGNAISAAITFLMAPVFAKRHDNIF